MNNAGTALYSLLQDTTVEQVDEVFAVHVKGPLFLTQTLEPLLRDGGRIVNISTALTRMAITRSGPYAAAKGAVEVLTRYQALEYGARGITANVVAVGPVPTDFGGGHLRSNPELQESMADAAATKVFATERIQRIGRIVDEIVGRYGDFTDPETAALVDWLDAQQKRNSVITFGGGVNEVMRDMISTSGLGLPRAAR